MKSVWRAFIGDSKVFFHEQMEVMIDSYEDDLMVVGPEAQVDKIFEMLSEHLTIKRENEFGKDGTRDLGKERRLPGQLSFAVRPPVKHFEEFVEETGVEDLAPAKKRSRKLHAPAKGKRESRRSTSSGMVTWGNFLIQSFSRTQGTVALSSCEAEMVAMTSTAAESIFVRSLLSELGYGHMAVTLRGDSISALQMFSRSGVGRMRHISIRMLWLQDHVASGGVILEKMPGLKNPSDLGTNSD